jgi:tetratricopeptide (TPR) repeat protein
MVGASSSWRVATMRPGEDPIYYLAAALDTKPVLGAEGELAGTNRVLLEATLRRGTRGLVEAVRQARIPSEDNFIIVVDQFEELFRFRASRRDASKNEALAFVKLLLEAAKQTEYPIYVVLTMRSDFIGDCMDIPGLPEMVNSGQYLVPRMTRDELRSAITGPIAVGGGEIAQRLILRLLNEFGDESDQLPVLQHALMRTWDHWQHQIDRDRPLDFEDYEAIGTFRNALSMHCEEAYHEASADHREKVVERMFKALTDTFSDPRGVRRPTSLSELSAVCEVPEMEVTRVIEVFRQPNRCFLTPQSKTVLNSWSVIDLSHESLMRGWTRLAGWAEEERASAAIYVRLSQDAAWFAEGQGGLWSNPELDLGLRWKRENRPIEAWAERYNSSFVQAMEFLDRSEQERTRSAAEQERERKKKLRNTQLAAGILGVLAIVAVVLALMALKEKRRAEASLQFAKKAVDESLSSAGREQARAGADSPQIEEFRKELLDKAAIFYAALGRQYSSNEALRSETASAHSRLGDINRLLQRYEDAVREYNEAIARFEALKSEYPSRPQYARALAYAHNWMGETFRLWWETAPRTAPDGRSDAEKQYDAALSLQQQIHGQAPADSVAQQELARTYYNRGIVRYDSGNIPGAENDSRKAISLLEPLARKTESDAGDRSTPDPSQELARVYNNLANLLVRRNEKESDALYEHAIETADALNKKWPNNREYRMELAQYCNNYARLLAGQKQLGMAQEKNHKAIDLLEELMLPSSSLSMSLVKALQLRTEILEAQGYITEERRESDRLFETLKKLSSKQSPQEHPEFHALYMNLGVNYINLAQNNLRSGDLRGVKAALERLAEVLPELSATDREALTKSYKKLQDQVSAKRGRGHQ